MKRKLIAAVLTVTAGIAYASPMNELKFEGTISNTECWGFSVVIAFNSNAKSSIGAKIRTVEISQGQRSQPSIQTITLAPQERLKLGCTGRASSSGYDSHYERSVDEAWYVK